MTLLKRKWNLNSKVNLSSVVIDDTNGISWNQSRKLFFLGGVSFCKNYAHKVLLKNFNKTDFRTFRLSFFPI